MPRICKSCGISELSAKWVTIKGKPNGLLCMACKSKFCAARLKTLKESSQEARAKLNKQSAEYAKARRVTDEDYAKRRNAQSLASHNAAWASNEEWRAKRNAKNLAWAKDNPEKVNTKTAARRNARLQRTPTWLSSGDAQLMEAKYSIARWLSEVVGVAYHVDHIVPLQGVLVSGLHVPWNTQVILATENLSKQNKFCSG